MDEQGLIRALAGERVWNRGPSRGCPDDLELAAYADARLEEPGRQWLESHVADCGHCLAQVGFLRRARAAGEPAGVPAGLLERARRLVRSPPAAAVVRWRWAAAAAAAASVAIAASVALHPSGTGLETAAAPARVRGALTEAAAPPEVLLPREDSKAAPDLELRWTAVDRALFYELKLVTAEGDVVWEDRLETTHARLPSGLALATGARHFFWVRAYLPEGVTLKSRAVGFEVAGRP